ncbi:restriction endonuclease subunit M [Aestuariimicrobium kwangyangense]|uniref:restriction endonuclease subunit M n=1 Tax=Aestuariimicrobium kwangyangense TaxID=396389 RepID=UPI0003B48724|nr:restriction endonuclease subunit M [Aestuariimicrobium kwangyangense]
MSASDAILIGEDWISEHYFTTDATSQSFKAQVLARRKGWDEQTEGESVRSRFTGARGSLLARLASLSDAPDLAGEIRSDLIRILGYTALGLVSTVTGPVTLVRQVSLPDGPAVALISATPVETAEDLLEKDVATLIEPYVVDDSTQILSVSRLLSAMFVEDDAPDFALVFAGRIALVAERERWPEGRYLAVDLQLVTERSDDKKGGETDTALACVAAESLAPDAEGNIWWHRVLEESINHTVGVSQDLREGVRLSIEIIANDVVTRRAARGFPPLPQSEAQPLAKQSLRFLYRILFLLYAEASPQLGVLPTGAPEYEQGYSLDRLRDLIQTPLTSPRAEAGSHLYESLSVLFRLVDEGYVPAEEQRDEGLVQALTFRSLRADLFRPEATALIDEVKLSNVELQRVLQNLLLSKEKRGSDRGFISYAELGINQLGAVYEGLMSYTGRFAETDLYEVAKGGDGSKGSWLVPFDRAGSVDDKDFIRYEDPITGERKPVLHKNGSFVFRLAGRERQQSASYYTPEVLTRFTVGQALEELLDQGGEATPAKDVLSMTVCEPALGSGAFAIEAVRQLAAEYLARRQDELGERIDPEEYPKELQKVKAYLALHNVYGVDLNSTAVELAEISLWLDTMMEGLQAPWFGLHLRRGNSLIGARRAVYARHQVEKKRAWLKDVPRDVPLTGIPDAEGRLGAASGGVHHFLLPAEGWGSAINAKEAKEIAPEALERLKQWRKQVLVQPTKAQVETLVGLGRRVETLWQLAWRRLSIAESEIRRSIDVWGADDLPVGGAVTRDQIEENLANPNGAYRRLRRVMDAWCALWFWPLTEETAPPSIDEWIETLQKLLGRVGNVKKQHVGQLSLASAAAWDDLGVAEESDLGFAMVSDVAKVLDEHPWLAAAERVAAQQGFFHWELDFAPVFSRGGFDLQIGNPPWVRPDWDEAAILAEFDPRWSLEGKVEAKLAPVRRDETLGSTTAQNYYLDALVGQVAVREAVSHETRFPHLVGLRPDLYRCFMEQSWRHAKPTGSVGLIHPETHFTDERAGLLRAATYRRLRRHWQFINELSLFEVHHLVSYGVHVYGAARDEVSFLQATSLYHPDTVERSLKHDGSGTEPGLKDDDGHWDLRPHAGRITKVGLDGLRSWNSILGESGSPALHTAMVYEVNRTAASVLAKLGASPRVASSDLRFSPGLIETDARKKHLIESRWGEPSTATNVVLLGPNLHVNNPFYKSPNPTMRNNLDWSLVDTERLPVHALPVTSYKPLATEGLFENSHQQWDGVPSVRLPRVAWRGMAANTGERTLIPTLLPSGFTHVNAVFSAGSPRASVRDLALVLASMSSLLGDFVIRSAPKSGIYMTAMTRIPLPSDRRLLDFALLRVLRLNCLTEAYREFWDGTHLERVAEDYWTGGIEYEGRPALGDVPPRWSGSVPLRRSSDRRQAQLEVDALMALETGVTIEELITIYRTQFPVLRGYDQRTYVFDANGRQVPSSLLPEIRKHGDGLPVELRSVVHPQSGHTYTYEPPYRTLDREADLRRAYTEFQSRLI